MPRARTSTSPPATSASAAMAPRINAVVSIGSSAMPDVKDIPVLHDVFLAFEPQRAPGARGSLRTGIEQRIPADGLGANKVVLQVGVNRARRLRSLGARRHRPRATLVF